MLSSKEHIANLMHTIRLCIIRLYIPLKIYFHSQDI